MGGGSSGNSVNINTASQLSSNSTIYTSSSLNDSTLLLGGENGISISQLNSNKNNTSLQKAPMFFNKPIFSNTTTQSNSSINKVSPLDTNSTNPKIYSICNINNTIYIGGTFSHVNNVEKNNIVRLNSNGNIDNDFNASINGSVYKITNTENNIYIGGSFGSYDENIIHSIAKLNINGILDKSFNPLEEFILARVNDMAVLPNNKILLAGTFLHNSSNCDENSSVKDVIQDTSTVLIVNENGTIDENFTKKFSDLKHEVFTVDIYNDSIYIGGSFEFTVDNKIYNNLVAYSTNGEFLDSFHIGQLHGTIFDVKATSNKVIYAGDFIMDDDLQTRSFYIVDLFGKTIEVNNFTVDSDIYSIETYEGNIVLTGEGNFKISDKQYTNSISLNLEN